MHFGGKFLDRGGIDVNILLRQARRAAGDERGFRTTEFDEILAVGQTQVLYVVFLLLAILGHKRHLIAGERSQFRFQRAAFTRHPCAHFRRLGHRNGHAKHGQQSTDDIRVLHEVASLATASAITT